MSEIGELIRIRGVVQGVGFRPTVYRVAREHGIRGEVLNDGEGVLIRAFAPSATLDRFVAALVRACPPLGCIDSVERRPWLGAEPDSFTIAPSRSGAARTAIVADAKACAECLHECSEASERRYRYPFTNCTHCGPRFSIVAGIPYDRANTSMAGFEPCADCAREYADVADRRHHAQPIACHACGPRTRLIRADGSAPAQADVEGGDDLQNCAALLARGEIVAIKGIGGFHLACDATRADSVQELRRRKQRDHKPFALMARSLEVVRRYCAVSELEGSLLTSPAAPIVLLAATGPERLATELAPGQSTLGFMLPYTPLHHLLLRDFDRPIVLTSANPSDEPQCIDDDEAVRRLRQISSYLLLHDRPILNRVDDSVMRVMAGRARLLRRGRGYAPTTIELPTGFESVRPAVAMGGELKNTFCLIRDGVAILSQHIGDLGNAPTLDDYQRQLILYDQLFQHAAERIVVDEHPDYASSTLGQEWAERTGLQLVRVQHHHAHIAACLAENGRSRSAPPVLGIALDGLGYGADGSLWGGEFLLCNYRECRRVATLKPVALIGGAKAMRQPWRNTYAHLAPLLRDPDFEARFSESELFRFFASKPLDSLNVLSGVPRHSPLASSCGRLFDAVAAAIGICRDEISYEGQAALELEALIDGATLEQEPDELAYPFALTRLNDVGLPCLEPMPMWRALLSDLSAGTSAPVIAARFHKGLARALVQLVTVVRRDEACQFEVVALSGGVFQNKILLEQVLARLERQGLQVLTHARTPANDGGLALGQAVIAAARDVTARAGVDQRA